MRAPTTGSDLTEQEKQAEQANRLRAWRAIEAELSKRPEADTTSAAGAVIRRVRAGEDITNIDAVVLAIAASVVEGKAISDERRLQLVNTAFAWIALGCPGPEAYGVQLSRQVH